MNEERKKNMYICCNVDTGESRLLLGSYHLSKNFQVYEFSCSGSEVILYSQKHVDNLQVIRDHYNKSIKITSGFRNITVNKKVGGVDQSDHMIGLATDIVVSGVSSKELKLVVNKVVGYYSNIITYYNTNHVHFTSVGTHKRLIYVGHNIYKVDTSIL